MAGPDVDGELLRELLPLLGLSPDSLDPQLEVVEGSLEDALVRSGWTPPPRATGEVATRPAEPISSAELAALRTEVARLREALQHRPTTERAVGMVMMSLTCNEHVAWQTLVGLSQATNRRVRDIAASLAAEVEHGRMDTYRLAAALAALRVVPGS